MAGPGAEGSWEKRLSTYFAPAERREPVDLKEVVRVVASSSLVKAVLNAVDGYMVILDENRQILAANDKILDDLGQDGMGLLIGKRPGEALDCVNADLEPGGCGTSKSCSTCGAVITILESQRSDDVVEGECLMTTRVDGELKSLEFRIRCSPLVVEEEKLTVFILSDISGSKRKDALEQIFLHDMLNIISGLVGWSRLLGSGEKVDSAAAVSRIDILSQRLAREVQAHRLLRQAEDGELIPRTETFPVGEIIEDLRSAFAEHPVAEGKRFESADLENDAAVVSDRTILVRILTNMVKNAFEAIRPGEAVSVSFSTDEDTDLFSVSNPGHIPNDVATQIFKRSFSTKAQQGRGLGTYSMKIFGETILGGEVSFESVDGVTTFFIALPREVSGSTL